MITETGLSLDGKAFRSLTLDRASDFFKSGLGIFSRVLRPIKIEIREICDLYFYKEFVVKIFRTCEQFDSELRSYALLSSLSIPRLYAHGFLRAPFPRRSPPPKFLVFSYVGQSLNTMTREDG